MKNIILKNTIISLDNIIDEKGRFCGLNIKFMPVSQDHIYMTSEGEVVREFPEELYKKGFDFDIKSLVDFVSALNNNISTAMYNIRKNMPNGGELNYISKSKFEKNMFLNINVTKHFFRHKNLGRDKVQLSFIEDDEDFGKNEILMLSFTKKDVQILFNLICEITSSTINSSTFFIPAERVEVETRDFITETTIPFLKISNSIIFDTIWLHGQEILNLMYTIDQLNYEFEIEKKLDELNGFYRQIQFVNEDGIISIYLKKLNGKNEEEVMIDSATGKQYHFKIQISSYILTIISMFISVKMLQHGEFEDEEDIKTKYKSQSIFNSFKDVKYHISTKESFIGLGYKKTKKYGEQVTFVAAVKDNAFVLENEDGTSFDLMYEKDGKKLIVLDSVDVSLHEHWPKLLEALSMAYTHSYEDWDKTSFVRKFYTSKQERGKWFKYEFVISGSKENKAPAVLMINKIEMNGKDETLISSFRQPLFKKYLFQLLVMLLNISSYFEHTEFKLTINKKDIMKFRFKSMKKVTTLSKNEEIIYGFERDGDEFYWGIFSNNNHMKEILPDNDIKLLNISSVFRLLRGDWLPFVGERICIGPDRYLTDIYGEFFLEKNFSEGEVWASNIFFSTSFKEGL